MRKRTKKTRTPAGPVVSVGLDKNIDIDWTPAKARSHPRVATAKQGKLLVAIEEGRYPDGSFCLITGAGNGGGEVLYNIFSEEFTPAELDTFITLLIHARDKARSLSMPSDKREGAAA
jgi:hypothetical protein